MAASTSWDTVGVVRAVDTRTDADLPALSFKGHTAQSCLLSSSFSLTRDPGLTFPVSQAKDSNRNVDQNLLRLTQGYTLFFPWKIF